MNQEDAVCSFVPPFLLERLGTVAAEDTLEQDALFRAARRAASLAGGPADPAPTVDAPWSVHSAGNGTALPGVVVRRNGSADSGDAAVDEAAYGGSASLDLFREVYGRSSFDGAGAEVVMTVHYGRNYDNAFWNGTQLVFGDGDGRIFDRFTKPVDVLGHELTHAVTERTAGLVYRDQSGALNESISDVFASCLKQRLRGQTADQADWLIGEGLFLPEINARALRDMAAPGTAYDDPQLGRDPQVAHMADYVVTSSHNGGVHLNSGIPNRAFQLAAVAIGGRSWEGAGAIWYAALTGSSVSPTTDFSGFAAACVAAAGDHGEAVRQAWLTVGVTPVPGSVQASGAGPEAPVSGVMEVRRTGGFAGITRTGRIDLARTDSRATAVRDLVARVDLSLPPARPPVADGFVYSFCVPGRDDVHIPEHDLTDDQRTLAHLVLDGWD
ncbi:MAG: protealysin inhibitor emfourin [Nocardioidaceae bacterium]